MPSTEIQDADLKRVLSDLPAEWQPVYAGVLHPSGVTPAPRCPRAYLYSARLRWLPYREWKPAADLGTAVHQMLAALWAKADLATAIDSAATRFADLLTAPGWTDDQRAKATKNFHVARAMVTHWVATYGTPAERIASGDFREVLAVEQTINLPLNTVFNVPGMMTGTIDLALLDGTGATGDIWLWDHKTTSSLPTERIRGVSFDVQSKCYRLLWTAAHPDKPPVGIVHNAMRVPTIRLTKKETLDDYIKRVAEWFEAGMLTDPSAYPLVCSYQRFLQPLAEDEEFAHIITNAARWARRPLRLAWFPRNRLACQDRGRLCPYMHLCESSCSKWSTLLTTGIPSAEGRCPLYTKGPDPLADVTDPEDTETSEQ